jgi:transposase
LSRVKEKDIEWLKRKENGKSLFVGTEGQPHGLKEREKRICLPPCSPALNTIEYGLAWFKNQFSDFWVIFPALTVSFLLP